MLAHLSGLRSAVGSGSGALTHGSFRLVVLALVWGLTTVAFPSAAALLLAVHAALVIAVLGPQVFASRRGSDGPRHPAPARAPFVTVHVPICDEPPALVCRTLDALAALDYPCYEVIVFDNNTTDRAVWEPVRDHCFRLGARFRFFHEDRLDGAKAGALNRCLLAADSRAEWVLTVDADYVVEPGLLRAALPWLGQSRVGAVQFPQAYVNGASAPGLTLDYRHFFDALLPWAARHSAMLLTGTLSLIRRRALVAVGGWSGATITEDAELGVRLAAAGWEGRYLPVRAGRGLMPAGLDALRAQRARWACGNAQVLRHVFGTGGLRLRQRLAIAAQLGAWWCGLLLPALSLFALTLVPAPGPAATAAAWLAALTLGAAVGLRGIALWRTARRAGFRTADAGRALAVHLGLAWEGATAWPCGLLGAQRPFVRTCKDADAAVAFGGWWGVGSGLVLALAGLRLVADGWLGPGVLAAAVGVGLAAAALYLHRELRSVHHTTQPLHAAAERRLARHAEPAPLRLAS